MFTRSVVLLRNSHCGKGYKIDIALGETALRVGVPLERLLPRWDREAQEFAEQVRPYLLYK